MKKNIIIYLFFSIIIFMPLNALSLRIVSLSPSITEIIFALNAGDFLVGNTTFCNYPEKAKHISKIGSYAKPSLEKIYMLKPDIVLGMKSGTDRTLKMKLDEINIKNKFYMASTVKDIKFIIQDIAKITNKDPLPILKWIDKYFKNYPKETARGIFLINISPMIAVGGSSFVNEILKCAGVRNIVISQKPYPLINKEFIVREKPDIIILSFLGEKNYKIVTDLIKIFKLKTKLLKVNSDIYNRPSYRIVDACTDLRKKIKELN